MTDNQYRACAMDIIKLCERVGEMANMPLTPIPSPSDVSKIIAHHFPQPKLEEWIEKCTRAIAREEYTKNTSLTPFEMNEIIASHAPSIRDTELYRAFCNGHRRLIEKGKDNNPPSTVTEYVRRLADFYGSDTLADAAKALAKIDAEVGDD